MAAASGSNKKDGNNSNSSENIFRIVDGIIYQQNMTKKLFIVMIIATVVAIPLTFHVTFTLLEPPYNFGIARIIPALIALMWLIIGIRQWLMLSKWAKKYERYKELQKKIDAELDFDDNNGDNNDNDKKENKGD